MNVHTPNSLKNLLLTDIFADVLEDYTGSAWYAELYDNLWARYRHRMITSLDVGLWEQIVKDRTVELMTLYKPYLDAFYALSENERLNIVPDGNKVTTWNQREDLPDTPTENIPDVQDDSVYLTERGKSITQTEGATTPILTLSSAFENRMELIRRFVDDMGSCFLNRWA